MFEIGFPELLLIAIVGLLVIGPDRLPEALRTLGLWLGRMRRSFSAVKAEIEKEIGMDEVRRQLHNEALMEEMKRIEAEVKHTADTARDSINQGAAAVGAAPSAVPTDPGVHADVAASVAAQDNLNASTAGDATSAAAESPVAAAPGAADDDSTGAGPARPEPVERRDRTGDDAAVGQPAQEDPSLEQAKGG